MYRRDGADLQFLTCMSAAVQEQRPEALVLLTAGSGAQRALCSCSRTCLGSSMSS